MGEYTANNWFYKPAKGAYGDTEKGYFDAALDAADLQLEDSKNISVIGNVPFPVLGGTGYETIAAAITTIGSTATTLCIPSTAGAVAITGNTTIPANVNLRVDRGAYFNISTGVTLTINGTIEAGPYKIFAWTTTGKVVFGPGSVNAINFKWYGAAGDGSTDDTVSIQKIFDDNNGVSNKTYIVGNPNDNYKVTTISQQGTSMLIINGNGCTFTQSGESDLFTIYNYGKLVIKNTNFVGSNTTTPAGSCIKLNHGGNLYAENLDIRYFDKAIYFFYSLYNQVQNCLLFYNNYAVYGEKDGSLSPNFNLFSNVKMAASKVRAIYFSTCNELKFDHCSFEGADISGNTHGIATIEDCSRVVFENCYHEPLGDYSDTTNLFSFSNTMQVCIANSYFAMGDDAGLNEAIYLTSNCSNIEIDQCYFNATNYTPAIYTNYLNTSRGITISNCSWSGVRITNDYIPTAYLEPNNYFPHTASSWVVMQASFVKMLSSQQTIDYGWKYQNRRLSYNPSCGVGTNATLSIDETVGYLNNSSYKIVWTDANNLADYTYLFDTGPNQTGAYGIISFFAKSDTDQILSITSVGGLVSSGTPLKGDNNWYYICQFIGSASFNPASVTGIKISSDATSGNLWVSDFSVRYSTFASEAMSFVGTFCGYRGNGLKLFTANDVTPSVKVGPLDKMTSWKTQNTETTRISKFDDPYMGQIITINLADSYTTIAQWRGALDYIYTVHDVSGSPVISLNHQSAQSWDAFDDSGMQNDVIYFGSQDMKFGGVRIKIDTPNDFTGTWVWEYWNGTAWTALTTSNDSVWKGTTDTWYNVLWSVPANWQQNVPVVTGASWNKCYWVRSRLSAFTSGSEGGSIDGDSGFYGCYSQYIRLSGLNDLAANSNSYDSQQITMVFDGLWREISRSTHQ